tara:strand:+ start:1319 stop:1858 length:540 start_codon:yes stop_codon:yes gene_type:complete
MSAFATGAGAVIGAGLGYYGALLNNEAIRDAQDIEIQRLQQARRNIAHRARINREIANRRQQRIEGAIRNRSQSAGRTEMGLLAQIDFDTVMNNVIQAVNTAAQGANQLFTTQARIASLQTQTQAPAMSAISGAMTGAQAGASMGSAMGMGGGPPTADPTGSGGGGMPSHTSLGPMVTS